jgi:hypothetical protein
MRSHGYNILGARIGIQEVELQEFPLLEGVPNLNINEVISCSVS